ncbi:MAG: hydroxymethylglutaryl-CoA synthase [Aerococcus sp.]|nr:hydroxymethylglutaryl-CoA synthase [Aerococcus sp.]
MKIGIDKLAFYTPGYALDMTDLAEARGVDPAKFHQGLGQDVMAVAPQTQDAVTLALNAAERVLDEADKKAIDLVILATESGVDQSKAGAIYLHHLLNIQPYTRSIEVKEACYSGTFGLHAAVDHVKLHPDKKTLVVASDIARYGLNTSGEVTQGAGAVAILISADPKIAVVNDDSVALTRDIMDFWRPNYSEEAKVDGHYSNEQYLDQLAQTWAAYKERNHHTLDDFAAVIFHLPYTKMGVKGMRHLLAMESVSEEKTKALWETLEASRTYNRQIGNIYTGSLYLSLISLLSKANALKAADTVGLYSYGSGAVSEFYSITLVSGYHEQIDQGMIEKMLSDRKKLTVSEYEALFECDWPTDGRTVHYQPNRDETDFRLLGFMDHQRQYGKSSD